MVRLLRAPRKEGFLAVLLLLAACGQQGPTSPAGNAAGQAAPPVASAAPPAKAFAREEETDLFEFNFSWSAEAAAVPELVSRFESEMAKARAEIAAGAEEDAAMRKDRASTSIRSCRRPPM